MKHIGKRWRVSALVFALSEITYSHAGRTAEGASAPGPTVASIKTPNERNQASPDVAGSAAVEARSAPPGNSDRGKTNGLNRGTFSGANSDVNRTRNGPKQTGR